jgi:hypothetical protein
MEVFDQSKDLIISPISPPFFRKEYPVAIFDSRGGI